MPVDGPTSISGVRQIADTCGKLWSRRDLRVVVIGSALLGLATSFVSPFFSMFGTREVGMSLTGFSAFMISAMAGNIAISSFLAHRSDHQAKRRSLLLIGSAAGIVGYAGYAFARDVWLLVFFGAVVLGVASVTFSQLFAYGRSLLERGSVPASDAPLYMSALRMCFAFSWTVGPAIAALTLRAFSFRGLFLAASGIYATLFVLVLGFVPAELSSDVQPRATPRPVPSELTRASRSAPVARGAIGIWFAAFVLVFAAHYVSISNMSLFVINVLGGDEGHVGVIFSLAPIFELPFMLYFGLLATRASPNRLIRGAVLLAFVYYALLSRVRAPWHIYPLQILSAAIVAVTGGVAISFFQDKFPGRSGAATNLYVSATRVGTSTGFLLFGLVASRFGHRGTYVACALLALASLAFALWAERVEVRSDVARDAAASAKEAPRAAQG